MQSDLIFLTIMIAEFHHKGKHCFFAFSTNDFCHKKTVPKAIPLSTVSSGRCQFSVRLVLKNMNPMAMKTTKIAAPTPAVRPTPVLSQTGVRPTKISFQDISVE